MDFMGGTKRIWLMWVIFGSAFGSGHVIGLAGTEVHAQFLDGPGVLIQECTIESADRVPVRMLDRGLLNHVRVVLRNSAGTPGSNLLLNVDIPAGARGLRYLSGSRSFQIDSLGPGRDTVLVFNVLADEGYSRDSAEIRLSLCDRSLRATSEKDMTFGVLGRAEWFLRKGAAYDRIRDYERAALYLDSAAAVSTSDSTLVLIGLSSESAGNRDLATLAMRKAAKRGSVQARDWLSAMARTAWGYAVSYRQSTRDLFKGLSVPVAVGILRFTDGRGTMTDFTDRAYEAFRKRPGVDRKLRLYSYPSLNYLSRSIGSDSLNARARSKLEILAEKKGIEYFLSGVVTDTKQPAFRLEILRIRDNETVGIQQFRTTATSTALNDMCKYVMEGLEPVYKSEQQSSRPH
jgi:hypothetical protein